MEKKNYLIIGVAALISSLLIGVAMAGIVTGRVGGIGELIKANSCDADFNCEARNLVTQYDVKVGRFFSTSGLTLFANTIQSKSGQSLNLNPGNGWVETSANIHSNSIVAPNATLDSIRTKTVTVDNQLSVENVKISGNTISTNNGQDLILTTSASPKKIIYLNDVLIANKSIQANELAGNQIYVQTYGSIGGIILTSINFSNFIISTKNKDLTIDANTRITNLVGSGNAYTCVNPDGRLYRSTTPCV